MAAYPYVGTYGLTTEDDITFTLEFSIPDNCNYQLSGSAGLYFVTINLNAGQTQPSTTFTLYSEDYSPTNNSLTITFDQPTATGRLKKPSAKVSL